VAQEPSQDTEFQIRSSYQRSLAPGETVFDEGDPGDRLYVIQSGEIELTREGPGGQRVVARLGPGDFFGELSVVTGECQTTRAAAVSTTRVLELDRDTLESMCLAQPEIAMRMIRVLVARLIEAERRLALLGVDDLLRPVVRALVRGAEPDEGHMRIPTTLRRLAGEAGLSMREAHRALHQLFDRKLIRLVDDVLIAPDLEALNACLDAD
jgi:CRP/FNR family cyclic AMP-dependent transcriptional regulator